jgi:hypothetical protein
MTISKERIMAFILSDEKDFKRFELLEQYIQFASEEGDVLFLLKVLRKDQSSIVRHEAAAQLLKIEQRKPELIRNLKDKVIDALLVVVMNDKSLVAKHESVEALSYIGDNTVLPVFNKLLDSLDKDNELIDSVHLAKEAIEYRISKNIMASELGEAIMAESVRF